MKQYDITILHASGTREDTIFTGRSAPDTVTISQLGGWDWSQPVPDFPSFEGRRCTVWADEEGKLKGLARNHAATNFWRQCLDKTGRPYDADRATLVGTIVIVRRAK